MRGSKYGNVYWVSIDFSCDKRHLGAVFSYPWCQTLSLSFLSFLTYKSQLFRPSPLALRRAHSGLALARTVSQRRQLSVARFEPAPTGWNFWLGWAASRLPSYRSASPPLSDFSWPAPVDRRLGGGAGREQSGASQQVMGARFLTQTVVFEESSSRGRSSRKTKKVPPTTATFIEEPRLTL